MRDARCRRRGSTLVYGIIAMVVLIGLTMLSVDLGRAQLIKTELRSAVDGCARYAVRGAGDGTAFTKANWLGAQNSAAGSPLSFAAADVEVGSWNATSKSFIVNGVPRTAVRLTGRRTVTPIFGAYLGAQPLSITVNAVCTVAGTGYGLIGIDSVSMGGNSTASYSSSGATVPTDKGSVASNGNITLGGSSQINGDVYAGVGKSVTGGTVSGTRGNLTGTLAFPPGDGTAYWAANNNSLIPGSYFQNGQRHFTMGNNQNVTLPGGIYVWNDVNIGAGANLTFSGPATIYCYGDFNMNGHATTNLNLPANLTIIMCPAPNNGKLPGNLSIGGTAALHATIYAPQSAVTLSGTGDIYGSVLGKSVSMTGTSKIVYDMSLDPSAGTITLVK
jgi:hypothetical protein